MNATDLHHIRAEAAMRAAQQAYDDLAEPECDEDVAAIREQMRLAEEFIGRAERALDSGDVDACTDLLGSAVRELGEVATEEQS